jgi:hypothetical protein
MNSIKPIECPICTSKLNYDKLFSFNQMPPNQHVVYKTADEAKHCKIGDINLVHCNNCGFIFNTKFDNNLVNYSEDYNNNPLFSQYYVDYLNVQIDYLIKNNYLSNNSTIIEVGCGKGYYLDFLSKQLKDCSFYGFDTSYEGTLIFPNKNITYYKSYYPDKNIILHPNMIINRHVIEHIPSPITFLKSLRETLDINNYLFLETPDFNWILKNNSIFDFFYEHCNYWLPISISNALTLSGYQVIDITSGYEDQYLWIIAKAAENYSFNIKKSQHFNVDLNKHFSKIFNTYSESLKRISNSDKKIALWGAGPKGYSFVNFFDPNSKYVSCLIDINTSKQHCYIGKTAHKIISPNDIKSSKINFIIIMNPNYYNEITLWLNNNGLNHIEVILVENLLV